jgi:ParB-like chromosome segregation protein Spo0J
MTTPAPKVETHSDLKKVPTLDLHPFCEIIPPCTEAQFKELKEDIKKNGLQVPIKTFETKILDGRNRYEVCVELENEGHPVEFKRELFLGGAKEALAYVISANVKRRHLSASQRALIVARLVSSKLGGDRSVKLPTEITQEKAARLAGVSVKMVTDAAKILKRPDLAEKVLSGELAVAKAAKQVRDVENQGSKKPKPKTMVEFITPHDAPSAVNAYRVLSDHLLEALDDLQALSSVGHATEYAERTIEVLQEKIAQMQPEEEETEKEMAD